MKREQSAMLLSRMESEVRGRFRAQFGVEARVFRAPGRVNLIGEHTDYNDGFVFPAAINFATLIGINTRPDRKLVLVSEEFSETIEIDLDDRNFAARGHWSDYVVGTAVTLESAGHRIGGANLVIHGDVPIGSGLSSSAALEVSTATALNAVYQLGIGKFDIAKLCQRAENEFVGARCGIMDQFVSCHGVENHALLLDCRSLEYTPVLLPGEVSLVICNTMVKHELASGEYNQRRAECEEGVSILKKSLPGTRALRDVSPSQLEQHSNELPEIIYRRCKHVVNENARAVQAMQTLRSGDLAEVGRLMAASHISLRDLYSVSCFELDLMVELANKVDGAIGARMTGGGFGGCTINLVHNDAVDRFRSTVKEGYKHATGIDAEIYVSRAANGAEEI